MSFCFLMQLYELKDNAKLLKHVMGAKGKYTKIILRVLLVQCRDIVGYRNISGILVDVYAVW